MNASAEVITAVPRTETKVKIHPIAFSLDPKLNMINTKLHMGAELWIQKLANLCSGVLLFALIRYLLPPKKTPNIFTVTSFSIPQCSTFFYPCHYFLSFDAWYK